MPATLCQTRRRRNERDLLFFPHPLQWPSLPLRGVAENVCICSLSLSRGATLQKDEVRKINRTRVCVCFVPTHTTTTFDFSVRSCVSLFQDICLFVNMNTMYIIMNRKCTYAISWGGALESLRMVWGWLILHTKRCSRKGRRRSRKCDK